MFDNDHSEAPVENSSENEDVGDVSDVEHIHRLRWWDCSRDQVRGGDQRRNNVGVGS